jgi:hypothetical protein
MPLISAAFVGKDGGYVNRYVGTALLDEVVDLLIDFSVSFEKFTQKLFLMPLFLKFIVDVVLEEVFLIELEQGVKLQQLIRCLLFGWRLFQLVLFVFFLLVADVQHALFSLGR